jgi:hypothetical protein
MKYLFVCLTIVIAMSAWVRPAQASFILHKSNTLGLTNGLVGWWTFDGKDMAGNYAFDKSGNGNRGTLTGTNGVPARTIGKIGQGLEFDGVDDYVNVGSNTTLDNMQAWSVSAWIYIRNFPADGNYVPLVEKVSNGAGSFYLYLEQEAGAVKSIAMYRTFSPGTNMYSYAVNNTLSANKWTHVIATFDNNNDKKGRLYVNGSEVAYAGQTAGSGTLASDAAYNAHISNEDSPRGSNAKFFNGLLDDVRIYNRVLSADEIKRLYNLGGTVKLNTTQNLNNNNSLQNGLVGWWTFDGKDMAGNYAFDKSGSGNRGTLTGTNGLPIRTIGKIGQGMQFDGVGDWVDFGDPVPLRINGDLTIAAWVKTTNTTKSEMMIITQIAGGNNRNYQLYLTTNADLQFTHGSGTAQSGYATAGTSLADGKWHHVAFTADYPSGTYYIDGKNVKSIAMSFDVVDTSALSYHVGGASAGQTDTMFDGTLDDVRIYNRVLSADEIKRLYNMGR